MNDVSNLRDTIIPKSDQLNADDLVGGPMNIIVSGVSRGNHDNPLVINYSNDNGRPFKPCKTVRKILIAAWGENGNDWVGRSMTLFCDSKVKWAGKEVGGIRVSHLSHITKRLQVNLQVTRGKKEPFIINILQPDLYPDELFDTSFDKMKSMIESGKMTIGQVISKCNQTGMLSDRQLGMINSIQEPVNIKGFNPATKQESSEQVVEQAQEPTTEQVTNNF